MTGESSSPLLGMVECVAWDSNKHFPTWKEACLGGQPTQTPWGTYREARPQLSRCSCSPDLPLGLSVRQANLSWIDYLLLLATKSILTHTKLYPRLAPVSWSPHLLPDECWLSGLPWLRFCAPNAWGPGSIPGSIPGQETRSHMLQLRPRAAKKKKNADCPCHLHPNKNPRETTSWSLPLVIWCLIQDHEVGGAGVLSVFYSWRNWSESWSDSPRAYQPSSSGVWTWTQVCCLQRPRAPTTPSLWNGWSWGGEQTKRAWVSSRVDNQGLECLLSSFTRMGMVIMKSGGRLTLPFWPAPLPPPNCQSLA